MRRRLLTFTAISGLALLSTPVTLRGQSSASWLQWGGPTRNFVSDSKGLASTWPAGGPKKLWSRALGEGHSSIAVENGRLYTLYREINRSAQGTNHEEVVAAFEAATGKTIWEFKYPASTAGIDFTQGLGPHSTPLIVGNRIYTTSSRSELFALDKASGKRIWSHDM